MSYPPLLGFREAVPDVGAVDLHRAIVQAHGIVGVEVGRPVDAYGRVPLLLLALVIEAQELVAAVLVLPRELGLGRAVHGPARLGDRDRIAEHGGHRRLLVTSSAGAGTGWTP